jgi:glycosyltransferase involved in cell wall biosynthesis
MMKFLYVSTVENSKQYSGILKKIIGQTAAVARLGWEAHYTYLDGDAVVLSTNTGELFRKQIADGLRWRKRQEAINSIICKILADNGYDAVYIKGFLATPYGLRAARSAKCANAACRVIYEVATYPYWGEYRRYFKEDWQQHNFRAFAGHILECFQHLTVSPRMKKETDAVAIFGQPIQKLWGIPAITVDNGIDIERIALRQKRTVAPHAPIRLLGVAGTSIAHGYSRILEGMASYREQQTPGEPDIYFDIAGDNATIQALKELTAERHLMEYVTFLGYCTSDKLAELYGLCDAAVSSLGVYCLGLKYLCPLKSREYCAAGIPFLYAYEDTLPSDAPFALKLPNNSTPVDMKAVVRFIENCRKNPHLSEQERQFATEHYDWRVIMKRVLEFAGAHTEEKN